MTLDPNDLKDLHNWSNSLLEEGTSRRKPSEAQWYENLATYHGDLWSEFDLVRGKLTEPRKPDHRVRLPVNLAQPAVRTEYAKLLKNRPMVDCLARSDDRSDLDAAEVGDKILNNYIEKNLLMPRVRRQFLQWLVICGAGAIFVDYNENAMGEQEVLVGPNNEPVYDERTIEAIKAHYKELEQDPKTMRVRNGELRNVALSPFQWLYDFSKTDYMDAAWCIISEIYDVDEVFTRWGVEVPPDSNTGKPGIFQSRLIERLDIAGTNWVGDHSQSTQKLAVIHRMFVKPGHRYFPKGAEIVFNADEILFQRVFPWGHGMLPIGVAGHIPNPSGQYSMSVIPQVKPLVLEISKTISQQIENRNLMANPPWIIFKQNRVVGEIQNKPGARITIDWMPNVPEPHPVEMPDMPSYVQNLVPMMKEHVLEVTGQSEVSQGKVPAGARAGVTIAYLQEEDDTKLGPTVQEYEECIERVAWLQLSTIAEKYDAPRTIRIYRKHSDPEVFDFIGSMLNGVAGVVCQAGSALPRSKAAKQQFILDLWDRKLEQDPRKVREMLELSQGDPDEWEVDIQQAERENRKMAQGQQVIAQEWQNHPAHHYQHRQFMKSTDWENLPPEVQQLYIAHDAQHTMFEQNQQRQQAVMAAMNGGAGGTPPGPPPTGGANGTTATPQPQFSPQQAPAAGAAGNVQDYQPQ